MSLPARATCSIRQHRIITVKREPIPKNGNIYRGAQREALATYIALNAIGHFTWELLQLPFYSIWTSGSTEQLIFAIIHCTIGDVMIAFSVVFASAVLWRSFNWPARRYWLVAFTAIVLGLAYTGFSEWLNVYVRQSWQYASSMPVFRFLGYNIGLSPLAQWVIVPGLVFFALCRLRPLDASLSARRQKTE